MHFFSNILSCIHYMYSEYNKLDLASIKIDLDTILYDNNDTTVFKKFLAIQFVAPDSHKFK